MTLTEMLNSKGYHYESMDEGTVICISDAKEVFKEWLGTFVKDYPNSQSLLHLLLVLVDEP